MNLRLEPFVLIPHGSEGGGMDERAVAKMGKTYKQIDWFFFSFDNSNRLWTDPYWYTSLLLQLGFTGIGLAAFISLLQVETFIYRAWILWIFSLVQIAILFIHTFIYGFYRINNVWLDVSIHHAGRINSSLVVVWTTCILIVVMLSQFISSPQVPECCNELIPGLAQAPLDILLTLKWYCIVSITSILCFNAWAVNYVAITSLIYPERKMTQKEKEKMIKIRRIKSNNL